MSGERWIRGIDEPLPPDEEILWSGGPDARLIARHVFHIRVWAAYLGGLVIVVGTSAASRLPLADAAKVTMLPLLVTAIVLAAVRYYASATARNSAYVITSKRIVLRAGIAFPMAINIPFRLIDEAGMRVFRDGSGEVRLQLPHSVRLAYIALWPHVETLRYFSHPRPKLRGLADPRHVGQVLTEAIAAADAGSAATRAEDETGARAVAGTARVAFIGSREAYAQ